MKCIWNSSRKLTSQEDTAFLKGEWDHGPSPSFLPSSPVCLLSAWLTGYTELDGCRQYMGNNRFGWIISMPWSVDVVFRFVYLPIKMHRGCSTFLRSFVFFILLKRYQKLTSEADRIIYESQWVPCRLSTATCKASLHRIWLSEGLTGWVMRIPYVGGCY